MMKANVPTWLIAGAAGGWSAFRLGLRWFTNIFVIYPACAVAGMLLAAALMTGESPVRVIATWMVQDAAEGFGGAPAGQFLRRSCAEDVVHRSSEQKYVPSPSVVCSRWSRSVISNEQLAELAADNVTGAYLFFVLLGGCLALLVDGLPLTLGPAGGHTKAREGRPHG